MHDEFEKNVLANAKLKHYKICNYKTLFDGSKPFFKG